MPGVSRPIVPPSVSAADRGAAQPIHRRSWATRLPLAEASSWMPLPLKRLISRPRTVDPGAVIRRPLVPAAVANSPLSAINGVLV